MERSFSSTNDKQFCHDCIFMQSNLKIKMKPSTWILNSCLFLVDLSKIGVADQSIIVDKTPPVAGQVLDGSVLGEDMQFTKDQEAVRLFKYPYHDSSEVSNNYSYCYLWKKINMICQNQSIFI